MLVLITLTTSKASNNKFEKYWDKIFLSNEKPVVSDTMYVMVTTRCFFPNSKIVFNDKVDIENKPKVVLVVCNKLKWNLHIMKDLDEAMSFLPQKKDLVTYVEGVGKTFPLALFRSAGLTTQYNINVIMFDYPSLKESFSLAKGYYYSIKNIQKANKYFFDFLSKMQSYKQSSAKWIANKNNILFVHSMGNRLLKETIINNTISNLDTNLFNHLVINAPCVKQKEHSKWVNSIQFARNIFIIYNKRDKRLKSALLLSPKMLLGLKVHKPFASKAIYIDMKNVLNGMHNGFIYNPYMGTIPSKSKEFYTWIFNGNLAEKLESTAFEKLAFERFYRLKN